VTLAQVEVDCLPFLLRLAALLRVLVVGRVQELHWISVVRCQLEEVGAVNLQVQVQPPAVVQEEGALPR
jgi:hypothetical protein